MSAEPISASNFNFWEFVCCAKCQLPFNSGANGSTVPFWLTECGHVICNNHLNSDQTCAQCRSPGIQLIPLQLDMEPPMSEWFRSVPYILDSAAYAIKFQQESMASQIRNLKVRYQQQRAYIEKLKQENAQLKQTNEMLTMQVTGTDDHSLPEHEPAAFLNANGKRPMIDVSHNLLNSHPIKQFLQMRTWLLSILNVQERIDLLSNLHTHLLKILRYVLHHCLIHKRLPSNFVGCFKIIKPLAPHNHRYLRGLM
ncbi:hypothetical protein LENED_002770 [Lentinula edodes]|uniref:RING-type domain-containing protein n=1 Tax=Lentinula edodes TaxID=5353 RepID=A0A1Q3E2C2_LENED|nr:hypothetical protein LENED_002770 [Lentinula edodes]